VVIDTDGIMAQTTAQVEKAWKRVLALFPVAAKATSPSKSVSAAKQPAPEATTAKKEAQRSPVAETGGAGQDVLVRRARPSDIPSLLLLIQRASDGEIRLSRTEMLASFSERGYVIAQTGADIVGVVGWYTDSTTAVCVDQIYAHPAESIRVTGPAILQEIERSALELICEVVLVFLSPQAPDLFERWLLDAGYKPMLPQKMRRAWRRTVEERQPAGTVIMGKVLRDVRVA
jgi:N-acetylglutamate synthase-like GNAT family acetyltransferase